MTRGIFKRGQVKAIARKLRKKKRQRILTARGIAPSKSLEVQYTRALRKIVRKLQNQVMSQVLPALGQFEAEYTRDSPALISYLNGLVDDLAQQPVIAEATQARIAARMARNAESFNRRLFVKEVREAIGVNLSDIIKAELVETQVEAAVSENIDLIKSIPEKYHERLKTTIQKGIDKGDDFFSLRKSILQLGHSTEARARFIARDQIAKLNAAITQQRQTRLGITGYFWRTAMDERVRDSHAEKEGERFEWDNPPADTGHPGQDFQCRCIADPDLSQLLDLPAV